ncbi:MAG: TRAP transporter substrate-binding protein [Rhodobacterales bacterium]|nr:TRAP transporter substrate-binding protein [Rhodobacterales bacterium]MDX5500125.1 TRAP transporter substrate-binding protein [Rhodobacterales bacterium]
MSHVFRQFAAAAALVCTTALPSFAADVTLRVSNWLPVSHPIVKDIILPWADNVKAATEGRVEVVLLDAPLGPPPAHFDLVANGIADIGFATHAYTPGRFGLTGIGELPFLTPNSTAASVAFWRTWDAMLKEKGEHAGVKVLGLWGHGPGMLFMGKKAASPLADLKGSKIRIAGDITNQLVTNLGMSSIQAPSSETYEILHNGIADGIVFPPESIDFFKLTDTVTSALAVDGGMYNVTFFFAMNQARFDALPEADRAAIDKVSGEALARMAGKAWDQADAKGMKALEGKVTFLQATPDDMAALQKASESIYAEVRKKYEAKGVDFDKALEMYKAELAKVQAE